MPTGAKLLGAFIYCAIGALAAMVGAPGLPDATQPGQIVPLSALFGFYFGWSMIGKNVNRSTTVAQSLVLSIRTIVLMTLSTLFVVAGFEAYNRSIKLRYTGPIEAVTDVANLMIFFGKMAVQPPVMSVVGVGIIVGAVFVRWAGRVWE
jgi:hypothetical protein